VNVRLGPQARKVFEVLVQAGPDLPWMLNEKVIAESSVNLNTVSTALNLALSRGWVEHGPRRAPALWRLTPAGCVIVIALLNEPIVEHWHGTNNGYVNHECHCQPCRDAHATWTREARIRRSKKLAADDPRHGLANTYRNHGCHCEPCTLAHRQTNQKRPRPARGRGPNRNGA
jgi:hypothetical protein